MFHSLRVIGVTSEADTGVFGPRLGVPARDGARECITRDGFMAGRRTARGPTRVAGDVRAVSRRMGGAVEKEEAEEGDGLALGASGMTIPSWLKRALYAMATL
jgi:hypothetical protein